MNLIMLGAALSMRSASTFIYTTVICAVYARACSSSSPASLGRIDESDRFGVQLLAIVALWLLFLVTQQQKSKYDRCTAGYVAWFGAQAIFLLAVTAGGVFHLVRKASGDAENIDPEMREILLGRISDTSGEWESWLVH